MAKSQNSNKAPDATLTKLLEVEADLASQEATLLTQLEAIKEKRKSLENVIGIFAPVPEQSTAANQSPQASSTDRAVSSQPLVSPAPTNTIATTPAKSGKTKSQKTTTKQAKEKPSAQSAKASRKSQNWQQYVRDDFSKVSLPEAVSSVLQRKPNSVLGISDIMDAIFYDEMPREARGKAQNRLSNILSTGLKDSKWYRGRTGHYSVSRTAAMADLSA